MFLGALPEPGTEFPGTFRASVVPPNRKSDSLAGDIEALLARLEHLLGALARTLHQPVVEQMRPIARLDLDDPEIGIELRFAPEVCLRRLVRDAAL
jgi:hypothetical protein